ncbi:MAG: ABC transporter substrate-binding protein, partial [Oscillospiraceae bacterium]|nr:ABC transporter substrate-binding protein [Oscillospiraceae bacterium]
MKKITKVLAIVLALAMIMCLTACGGSKADDGKYTVGICQLVTHDALDAATQGFIDALNEALPGQVEFDIQNAAGDANTCSSIANTFVANG